MSGRPVLAHTLARFAEVEDIIEVIVAVEERDLAMAADLLAEAMAPFKASRIIAGGAERADTVAAALAEVSVRSDLVAIHDAVRPLVTPGLIRQVIAAASETGGAIVGIPIRDTVKRVMGDGTIAETVPRSDLWVAQTPQVFHRESIIEAYRERRAAADITDDAQVFEALGRRVAIVEGTPTNLKITTREDLLRAEALLKAGWPREG
jgi:2-C-methyl-D-erythritol 4-phosphate cytidylyltransferase